MRQTARRILVFIALALAVMASGCDSSSPEGSSTSTPTPTFITFAVPSKAQGFLDGVSPITSFEAAEKDLGWRIMRSSDEDFELQFFTSGIQDEPDGERSVILDYLGPRPGIKFRQLPMDEVSALDLQPERIGRFDVYSYPAVSTLKPSTRVDVRFATGETYGGRPIVGVVSGQLHTVRDFIESLTFGE